MSNTNVNPIIGQNGGTILRGEFATRIISLHHFAEIRREYPNIIWTDIPKTVGDYALKIQQFFIPDANEQSKLINAKEHLTAILQLEILRTQNFHDVRCSELMPGGICKSTCGCTDPNNDLCCCPDDAHLIGISLPFNIVWTDKMTLTAHKADGSEINPQLTGNNPGGLGLIWYEIPNNPDIAFIKIRLKWWEMWNTHEIAISDIV